MIRRLGEALRENLPYKVLSILIALSLWFIVRDQRIEETFTVALDVQPSGDLVVSSDAPPEISVAVTGTRVALDRLRHEALSMPVRVKATEPGVAPLHVRPEDVSLAPGVEAFRVSPPTVSVRLENRAIRKVAVRPRVVIDASDWHLKRAIAIPDRVRISGPASVVGSIDEVWTEPIPVTPQTDPITGSYPIALPQRQLRLEDPGPIAVRIELEKGPIAGESPADGASPAGFRLLVK